jgi:hypothetical protein
MEQGLIVNMDSVPLRFTPDGKVSVFDAIRAVSNMNCPHSIWENLKTEHPEILADCEDYSFQGGSPCPVIDSQGWERVLILLPAYLPYPNIT